MITQNEQLKMIEKIANQLFHAYSLGHTSCVAEFTQNNDHPIYQNFKSTFDFFLNRQYAQYRLKSSPDIAYPSGSKADYFLHLCCWSNDFRKRYKNFNQDLCELDLGSINQEQTQILKVLKNSLSAPTLIKFEESFDFSPYNEKLALFQKLILRLAKHQLGYKEDLVEVSNLYFNNEDPLNPQKLKNNLLEHKMRNDLSDKPLSRVHKI